MALITPPFSQHEHKIDKIIIRRFRYPDGRSELRVVKPLPLEMPYFGEDVQAPTPSPGTTDDEMLRKVAHGLRVG